jgi:hypothetical protein
VSAAPGAALQRRRALARTVAALVATASWACAADDGAAPDAPVAREEPWTTEVVVPGEPDPTVVAPRPGLADVRPHAFARFRPHPDERGLTVAFWGGVAPCFGVDHADVRESEEAVVVTLYAGSDPAAPNVACIEIAVSLAVDVRLSAPLGDRPVLDGAASNAPRPRY